MKPYISLCGLCAILVCPLFAQSTNHLKNLRAPPRQPPPAIRPSSRIHKKSRLQTPSAIRISGTASPAPCSATPLC